MDVSFDLYRQLAIETTYAPLLGQIIPPTRLYRLRKLIDVRSHPDMFPML